MKEQHLTEEQLQQYAAGTGKDAAVMAHLAGCDNCRRQVADYLLLFTELKNAPSPAFEFDVTALVVPQLPAAAPAPVRERYNNYLVPVIAVCAVLASAFVVQPYLVNLIRAVPDELIYPMVIIPVLVLLFRCFQLYRQYLKKINALNIY